MGDLIEVCESIGLPRPYATDHAVLRSLISPAVATTYAYAEIPHSPLAEPVLVEMFGTNQFSEGVFGPGLRALHEAPDPAMQQKADGFVRFFANLFAHQHLQGDVALTQKQKVGVRNTPQPHIILAEHSVPMARAAKVVIDYGPGLHAGKHIDQQFKDIAYGNRPYTLLAYDKGPYINEFLKGYISGRLGDDALLVARAMPSLYIGNEHGVAKATTELLTATKGSSLPAIADVVIACGIHSIGQEEITTGIRNAYELTADEGKLVVWAPTHAESKKGHMSAEEMIEVAQQSGFTADKAAQFEITNTRLGIKSIAAVLTK